MRKRFGVDVAAHLHRIRPGMYAHMVKVCADARLHVVTHIAGQRTPAAHARPQLLGKVAVGGKAAVAARGAALHVLAFQFVFFFLHRLAGLANAVMPLHSRRRAGDRTRQGAALHVLAFHLRVFFFHRLAGFANAMMPLDGELLVKRGDTAL